MAASLGLSSVTIRNPVAHPYKLNASFSFLPAMPFHFSHTCANPSKNQFRAFHFPSCSVSESSVSSPLEAETEAVEEDDNPMAVL
jgi:hypothetical protein